MENKNIMVGRHQELAILQEIINSPNPGENMNLKYGN